MGKGECRLVAGGVGKKNGQVRQKRLPLLSPALAHIRRSVPLTERGYIKFRASLFTSGIFAMRSLWAAILMTSVETEFA